MNFSPNIDSYNELEKEIESTLSAISNFSSIKFIIDSEDDISKDLDELASEVDSKRADAEKAGDKITKSLSDLVQTDFQIALESYSKTAYIFCENNIHEIFSDNYGNFPFNEWVGIKNLKYNFSELRRFFFDLPQAKHEDREIYFYNLKAAFSSEAETQKASFFKKTLSLISKFDSKDRDIFIHKCLEHNILKNTMMVMMLTDKLEHKYYNYEKWQPVFEQSLIEQCNDEEQKKQLINFLINDDVNNHVFCKRENRNKYYNPIVDINVDNFEKIIDLDLKLKLNLGNFLVSSLVALASDKNSDKNKSSVILDKCQGITSYMMAAQLEKNLECKTRLHKQIKI